MSDNDNDPIGPPIPVALALGFPNPEEVHVLWELRQAVEAKGRALGLKHVGGGTGRGGMDTQFSLGDQSVFVTFQIR